MGTDPKMDPETGDNSGTVDPQRGKSKGTNGRARVRSTSAHTEKAPSLPRRLYDLKGVAGYLGVSYWTVRDMIWRGDLPCVRIGKKQCVDIRDVDAFIEAQKERA